MDQEKKKYFLALTKIEGIQIHALCNLFRKVKDVQELFHAPDLSTITSAERTILKKIGKHKKYYIAQAEKEMEELEKHRDISIVTFDDEDYPQLLKKIFDPPVLLYVRGVLPSGKHISIVGSRESTREGNRITLQLARDLVQNGFNVVSGMALGIDTYAHRGALEASGKTIAVLGSGLFWIYPEQNKDLYERISENGAVISEFSLHQRPERFNFPRRNRIISGLSLGTIVVEAGRRSGALITASFALEQGREVFSVPGSVNSRMSEGTNRLIKDGAKLVQDVNDVLEEFSMVRTTASPLIQEKQKKEKDKELNEEEKNLLKMIDVEPVGVDELFNKTRMKINHLERTLMMLEIKGYVEQVPGHRFRLMDE